MRIEKLTISELMICQKEAQKLLDSGVKEYQMVHFLVDNNMDIYGISSPVTNIDGCIEDYYTLAEIVNLWNI